MGAKAAASTAAPRFQKGKHTMRKLTPTVFVLSLLMVVATAARAISPPPQLTPADGATITQWRNITFTWGLVDTTAAASTFGIEIQAADANNTWTDVRVFHGIVSTSTRYTLANFRTSNRGRWRVRCEGAAGTSAWSPWRGFRISAALPTTFQRPKAVELAKAFSIPAGGEARPRVACPSGSIAIGGGWMFGAQGVTVTSSSLDVDAWTGDFHNHDSTPASATIYVECLENASGYSFFFGVFGHSPQTGELGVATVTCSKGIVSGGGFATSSDELVPYSEEAYTTNSWTVDATNEGAYGNYLEAIAVCLVGSGATESIAAGARHDLAGNGSATAALNCGQGKVGLGGGWDTTHDGSFFTSSHRSANGNGWQASAVERDSDANQLRVTLMCAQFN